MKHIVDYYVDAIKDGMLYLYFKEDGAEYGDIIKMEENSIPLSVKLRDCIEVYEDAKGNKVYQLNEVKRQQGIDRIAKANAEWKQTAQKKPYEAEPLDGVQWWEPSREEELKTLNELFFPVDFQQAKLYDPNHSNSKKKKLTIEDKKIIDNIVKTFLDEVGKKYYDELTDNEETTLLKKISPENIPAWENDNIVYNTNVFQDLKETEQKKGKKLFKHFSYEDIEKMFITGGE